MPTRTTRRRFWSIPVTSDRNAKARLRRAILRGAVMSKTAADQIVEMMIGAGIRRVYGLVGDSINPITDAIRRTEGKLQWVHCRNEEVAAFAAGAEALL